MYCKKYSVLRPDQAKKGIIELQPVLGHQFLAFLNTLRQNLVALGLDKKKADAVLTPLELAAKIDAEKEAREGEQGSETEVGEEGKNP
jgi:hypothetical protein